MRRLEDLLPDPEWQLWVAHSLDTADVVLADVTDNNPFVMYELGVAHAQRVPTLLIVNRRNGTVPATVKGSFFLSYDSDRPDALVPRLADAVRRHVSRAWHTDLTIPADVLHAEGLHLLAALQSHAGDAERPLRTVTLDEFRVSLDVALRRGEIPALDGAFRAIAEILLPRMVHDSGDCEVMDLIERFALACPTSEPV